MNHSNEKHLDHEVRIRMLEEIEGTIAARFDRLEDKMDAQFKWFVGGILTVVGGVGLHLMGLM